MPSKEENERRRQIRLAQREVSRQKMLDQLPTSVDAMRGLLVYLSGLLESDSENSVVCDHSYRLAEKYLGAYGIEIESVAGFFQEHGGYCDCEILNNIPTTCELILGDFEFDWPFADPKNVVVITTSFVLDESEPITFVSHDQDDGVWQFVSSSGPVFECAKVVSLSEICKLDSTLYELADLPLGWVAERIEEGSPWVRAPKITTKRDPDAPL